MINIHQRARLGLSGLTFILFLTTAASLHAGSTELVFGSVAMDIPAVMYQRLKPLTQYLSDELGRPVRLQLSPNMGAAIDDTAKGRVDITYLTPVAYIKAHQKGGAQLIAKTVTNGKASFRLMIVVREGSPIRSIEDLKGKDFAFGDKRALLQRAAVVGSGLSLDDLNDFEYLGHYDNIARAVMNYDFDAGILKDTMAYKWQGKGLRIIYETPDLPPYNISASRDIDEKTLEALRNAFLSLDSDNPDHLEVIKAVDPKYDGFAATDDAEYDVVRRLIAPFNK